jgi:hypothetical protein
VLDKIVGMLDCHESQFYEWLPYNLGWNVPADKQGRRSWLAEYTRDRLKRRADKYRDLLIQLYGKERGSKVQCAEAFEPCEYGAPLDEAGRKKLFPFVK